MDRPAHPDRPGARQRLLAAADRLFYAQGINATGVDAVIAEADVARMTMYKQFGGKPGLVAAYLEERDSRWRADLERAIAAAGPDPTARLLAVFDALDLWASDPQFRGCSFANAAAELPDDDHPARQVALRHKQALRDRVTQLVVAAEVAEPERLVDQLMLLFEGAVTATAVQSVEAAGSGARATARQLCAPEP
jgi:AcrR family transcriptional regulator